MNEAFHLLHRAGQRAAEVFAIKCDRKELTPRQYAVLAAIADSNLPSQTELVSMTGVDRSTLADIVRRLVQRGLVHRKRTKHDARAYQLTLTEKGEAEREIAATAARNTDAELLSALSSEEQEIFLSMLRRIVGTGEAIVRPG
jgi:DNA-binding MarR family transcriptional regulator